MSPGGRRESDPRAAHLLGRFAACFGQVAIPVDVDALAADLLGLHVELHDDMDASGLLFPATMRVYVNAREARESEGRRRFTIAHEIGHWVCQCDEGRVAPPAPILCRDDDMGDATNADLEREANNFAASLLMPEAAVRNAAAGGMDVARAAVLFGVSPEAMYWRYFNLGVSLAS